MPLSAQAFSVDGRLCFSSRCQRATITCLQCPLTSCDRDYKDTVFKTSFFVTLRTGRTSRALRSVQEGWLWLLQVALCSEDPVTHALLFGHGGKCQRAGSLCHYLSAGGVLVQYRLPICCIHCTALHCCFGIADACSRIVELLLNVVLVL